MGRSTFVLNRESGYALIRRCKDLKEIRSLVKRTGQRTLQEKGTFGAKRPQGQSASQI